MVREGRLRGRGGFRDRLALQGRERGARWTTWLATCCSTTSPRGTTSSRRRSGCPARPSTARPCGPALVTADEAGPHDAIEIELTLNGETMQQASTADLVHPVPALVAYLSQLMTLDPGDVIATGTPAGVGSLRDPRVWLKSGDEIVISSPQLGVLETRIALGQALPPWPGTRLPISNGMDGLAPASAGPVTGPQFDNHPCPRGADRGAGDRTALHGRGAAGARLLEPKPSSRASLLVDRPSSWRTMTRSPGLLRRSAPRLRIWPRAPRAR